MADTAYKTVYKNEFIAAFEYGQSRLRSTVTTEFEAKGNTCTFLVAGSGSASAVTRGVDGLIPARADSLTQSSATLAEWHDLVRRTSFNIFSSQGDGKRIMQMTTLKVINRKIDADIIAQLDTATNDTGAAQQADLDLVMHARTILGVNEVPIDEEDNMFGVITPAFEAFLMQIPEYASSDFVEVKPFSGPARPYRRWAGVNWICHPKLTGTGTSSEKTYMYHRSSLGHAVNTGEMMVAVGYDEEQDYSYARTSAFIGSKLLQNSGVVQILHDGSGYAAA